jgi:death-on-curing protein
VPRLVVETAHLDQLREHGGLPGIRDENGLEAALARAHHKWTYQPSTDLPALASAYAFGIATAHPFNDGNKRTAFLAMAIFLGLNGKDLKASESEVVQTMISAADGSMDEAALEAWVRTKLIRLNL